MSDSYGGHGTSDSAGRSVELVVGSGHGSSRDEYGLAKLAVWVAGKGLPGMGRGGILEPLPNPYP